MRLDPACREFSEHRKPSDRGIFSLKVRLLEIDILRCAREIGPAARRKRSCSCTAGRKTLRDPERYRGSWRRSEHRTCVATVVIDVADHAQGNIGPGLASRLGGLVRFGSSLLLRIPIWSGTRLGAHVSYLFFGNGLLFLAKRTQRGQAKNTSKHRDKIAPRFISPIPRWPESVGEFGACRPSVVKLRISPRDQPLEILPQLGRQRAVCDAIQIRRCLGVELLQQLGLSGLQEPIRPAFELEQQ